MYITLNNNVKMPQIGLGVWQAKDGEEAVNAVKKALQVGYRAIDTAAIYENEESVGEGIRQSGVPRKDIFVTTKVWNSDQGYEETLKAFDVSLEKLGLAYVDLYLIHWPAPQINKYVETYKALEKLYADGRVRAIGVSNFHIHHLKDLFEQCAVKPVINQVELHPRHAQEEMRTFCKENDIYVEAWSPLMQGGDVLQDETIVSIGKKHGKTPAQVVIRWHLQNEIVVIPKSVTPSRIEENFNVFDFQLSEDEMKQINGLNENKRVGPDPQDYNRI